MTQTSPRTIDHAGRLLRYRVMAIVTGTALLILTTAMIPKYAFDSSTASHVVTVVGMIHGFLFMIYLLAVLDLGARVRWPILKLLLVGAAGTIPLLTFVLERRVTHELRG